MKTYRIKSRAKFMSFIATAAIVIFMLGGLIINNAAASGMDSFSKFDTVRVQTGDTLWDIAYEYNDEGQDVRKLIYKICDINNISSDELKAGQVIKVPMNL